MGIIGGLRKRLAAALFGVTAVVGAASGAAGRAEGVDHLRVPPAQLGIDLSVPGGYEGFAWGASLEAVKAKLGEPKMANTENGVLQLFYSSANVLSADGVKTFIFWEERLIAGESSTTGIRADRFEWVTEATVWAICDHFREPAVEAAPGAARWVLPDYDAMYLYICRDFPNGGLVFATVSAQLTQAHRFLRLNRFGPPLEEVEKMKPIRLDDTKGE